MKSVTEFFVHKLNKGIDKKTALEAEGKSAEEVEQALGEALKMEGDKLKHYINAMAVATEHKENLSRVIVVSLAEGETAPPKSAQVEEHHYVPEFNKGTPAPFVKKDTRGGGGGGGKGKGNKGPKPSPWGLSPDEIAAKKASAKASQKAASEAKKGT